MQTNVGNRDALVRASLSAGFFGAGLLIQSSMMLSFMALFLAVGLGVTALFGVCPLYALLHINTCREPGMPRTH